MKTIRAWLNELPEKERKKAFRYEQHWWDQIEHGEMNMKAAITSAFPWFITKEGHEYWSEIADRYK